MPSINIVQICGHLGRDPEVKFMSNGTAKMSFSVATSRRWKPDGASEYREETDWHNVIQWKPSDYLTSALKKGSPVFLTGRLQTRSYEKYGEKRYVTEIVADKVWPLAPKDKSQDGPQPVSMPRSARPAAPVPAMAPEPDGPGITDDDVPF